MRSPGTLSKEPPLLMYLYNMFCCTLLPWTSGENGTKGLIEVDYQGIAFIHYDVTIVFLAHQNQACYMQQSAVHLGGVKIFYIALLLDVSSIVHLTNALRMAVLTTVTKEKRLTIFAAGG